MRFDSISLSMSEAAKDPAIKLFGRTIPFPDAHPSRAPTEQPEAALEEAAEEEVSGSDAVVSVMKETEDVEGMCEKGAGMEVENLDIIADFDEGKESTQISSSNVSSVNEDVHKACSEDDKAALEAKADPSKVETDGQVQEKLLKKPDKILPCPRCNSMNTKFCYYNNYNINQPRHFCKNCQRYWTAGGTMRNVPVGAGRRRSKQSSSQYRHIMMPSEGLPSPKLDNPDLAHHQAVSCGVSSSSRPLTSNDTVLKFGPEVPLCHSMDSVLNIREQKRNGDFNSVIPRENKEEPSCVSSVTAANDMENGFHSNAVDMEQIQQHGIQSRCNGLTPLQHFQYYGGVPWPYPVPWVAPRCPSDLVCRPENCTPNPVPWVAPPAFCSPAIPFPFMSPSYWGCLSSWPNGAWNMPWAGSNGGVSPTSSTSNGGCSGNSSPTLGKHSRDASLQGEVKTEKSLWVPKTLRIDDPEEAAKSSIWSTLGIKPDEGGIFKSFQSKGVKKVQTSDAAQVLHANPAALSRSQTFQEST